MEVPISLVYRKDLIRYGGRGSPTLLQGYGAYGIAIDPYFDSNRLSILDRCDTWRWQLTMRSSRIGFANIMDFLGCHLHTSLALRQDIMVGH